MDSSLVEPSGLEAFEHTVRIRDRDLPRLGLRGNPGDAATVPARLLAQLDAVNAAGIVTTSRVRDPAALSGKADDTVAGQSVPGDVALGSTSIRFRLVPFPRPPPGHHTGAEYL